MGAEAQTERAFQKQEGVFLASKKLQAKKTSSGVRFYKKIGLGFKTPAEAIDGGYIDRKCPFTGNISIRGRIFKGVVLSTKMHRTIVIRRDYLHYIRKYNVLKVTSRKHSFSSEEGAASVLKGPCCP